MILNTGMRTDIPAFYSEWFRGRLNEGYVLARNPYDPKSVTKYRISPDVVDIIGFCTKDPSPMLPYMDMLSPYGQYWFVTITPYGKDIEPNVPPKEKVMEDLRILSGIVGINSVGWRYDPILINDVYTVERHISDFEKMACFLAGYTDTCVISFIDLYQKVKRNFPEARQVTHEEMLLLGKEFIRIGKKYGMTIRPCAEGNELEKYGADCGGCMTVPVYEKAIGKKLRVPKQRYSRKECACFLGGDIGAYDTCGHLCRYCYANADPEAVKRNLKAHDPSSPLLLGKLREGDIIREAVQESWADEQLSFF